MALKKFFLHKFCGFYSLCGVVGFFLCLLPFSAQADLVVAQVAAFSGPLMMTGKAYRAGVQIQFDQVNANGGVHGQKIRFVSADDAYIPSETVAQIEKLAREHKPVALIGTVGTANLEEILSSGVLARLDLPLVGARTGGVAFLKDLPPHVYITRANYAMEIREMVRQLWVKRVAVFYQDDGFGTTGLMAARQELENRGLELVATGAYERNTTQVAEAVQSIAAAQPEAIIMVSNTAATAEFIKQLRRFVTALPVLHVVSVTDGPQLARLVGNSVAHGVSIAQIVPNPYLRSTLLGQDLGRAYRRFPPEESIPVNYSVGEGYLAARVLVEGLRRAGPEPTPKKLREALDSLRGFDAYGVTINFSPKEHAGARFVEISVMDEKGGLRTK